MKPKSPSFLCADFESVSLGGGFEVLFFKDKSLPSIQYGLFLPRGGSGSSDHPGLAQFTLSLLDQGAGERSAEEIQESLNFYGTEINIKPGRESAKITLSGLSGCSMPLWELFYDIIFYPKFSPKETLNLKKRFVQERLQTLNDRALPACETWLKIVFDGSPFSQPVSGTVPSLKKITKEAVAGFYSSCFNGKPDTKKILSVTGNLNDSLKRQIEASVKKALREGRRAGAAKAGAAPARDFSPALAEAARLLTRKPSDRQKASHSGGNLQNEKAEKKEGSFHLLTNSDLSQSEILMGLKTPPFPEKDADLRRLSAFSLGNQILGGPSLSSRLQSELREKRGLTYGVFSMRTATKNEGFFLTEGNSRTETTAVFLKNALKILQEFTRGVSEEELQQAKTQKKSRFLSDRETLESRADSFIYHTYGLGAKEDFLDNYLKGIEEIRLQEVNQEIKNLIDLNKLHILIYGNPEIESEMRKVRPVTKTLSFKECFKQESPD